MSLELQKALSDYNIIASSVNEKWKATNNDYLLNYSNLTTLNGDKVKLEAEIETLENIKKTYEDLLEKEENKEEDNPTTYEDTIEENPKNEIDVINEQIEKAKEELQKVNTSITLIEEQINTLKESLENMTLQLDKTTTTYEDGSLVFNEKLLYELSEFIYWDTYSDDKYDSAESLLEGASREMAHRCKPTIEYEIESVNFLEQLLNASLKFVTFAVLNPAIFNAANCVQPSNMLLIFVRAVVFQPLKSNCVTLLHPANA